LRFARRVTWKENDWWMVANGPGPRLVKRGLEAVAGAARAGCSDMTAVVSIGFCGALSSQLRLGDIVVSGTAPATTRQFTSGNLLSVDRVAVTAEEKRSLFEQSGALAIEMESAAVKEVADGWRVPFYSVRSVSDTAEENLPLDFNDYRTSSGQFSRSRIALAALLRPFTAMPRLLELDRRSRFASQTLGDFLADCQF